jgi:membrane protein YqaA with SNARE-associated domain
MSKTKWQMYASFIGVFALAELIVVIFFPAYHSLVWFCFYTAISNFCIPWLPHEPAVLLYGKLYDPWLVAFVGGLATCWIEFFNYKLLTFLTHLRQVQAFTSKHAYQKAEGYFKKFPFLSLVISGFTPIPYAPFRVFAVTSQYPLTKYQLAVFVGRTPRYYILAVTGAVMNLPLWTYGLIFVVFLIAALWSRLRVKSQTQQSSPLPRVEQR